MSRSERDDAAKSFQTLEIWREQTVEILHFLQNVDCKHVLPYLDKVSRHSEDIQLKVPVRKRCCINIWQTEQVTYLHRLATGCKRHPGVKWLIEAFGRDHYPTLAATRKHLKGAGSSYSIENVRNYHHEMFLKNEYDASTTYILSYGPPRAYSSNEQQPKTGEVLQFTDYTSDDAAKENSIASTFASQPQEAVCQNYNRAKAAVDDICEGSFVTVWNTYTKRESEPIQARLSTFAPDNFISWTQLCSIGMQDALVQAPDLYTWHSDGTKKPALGYVDLYYAFRRRDDSNSPPQYTLEPARFHVASTLSHPFILGRHSAVGQLTSGFINLLPPDLQNQILSHFGAGSPRLEAGNNGQRVLTNGDPNDTREGAESRITPIGQRLIHGSLTFSFTSA